MHIIPKKQSEAYWEKRGDFLYYSEAIRFCRMYASEASTVLEVGSRDTKFLEWLDWIPQKVAIDKFCMPTIASAENIQCDFLTWQEPYIFDLGVCLQVVEHLKDVALFAQKLKKCCRTLIVSVPYMWPAGQCKWHIQDPVDLQKLAGWFDQSLIEYSIVKDDGLERMIAVFNGQAR
jgi:hypothetical protein